jgi:hypothetical protein
MALIRKQSQIVDILGDSDGAGFLAMPACKICQKKKLGENAM